MTTLKFVTVDQHLVLQRQPTVASGDKNSVLIQIELCSMWDGFDVKVAFYKDGNRDFVLDIPLEDGACMVPPEMLDTPCMLNIGIWGKDARGRYKTSTMVKYRVQEGTPTEAGVTLIDVSDGTATEDQVLDGATFYAGDTAKKRGNIATFEDGEPEYVLKGDPGESAYKTAVKHGFEGTEEEWLASLKKPAEDAARNVVKIAEEAAENALGEAKESGEFDGKSAYQYAQDGGYSGTEEEFSAIFTNAVDKRKITLGLHTDGLIYLFVDGVPVGNGIALPSGGISGDVVGNVDSANNIVLMGNLSDGTYSVKYEMEDGSTVNIGNLVLDSNVYYSVTKNLTNCTINNSATSIVKGESYSATISANDGYELKSVSVTMGGVNVSVTNGVINIASVTGNIVITAVAEEIAVEPEETNYFDASKAELNKRIGSSGTTSSYNGIVVTDFIPINSSMSGKILKISGVELVYNSTYKYYYRQVFYKTDKSTMIYAISHSDDTEYKYNVALWTSAMGDDTEGYIRISLVVKDNVAITADDIANIKITLE